MRRSPKRRRRRSYFIAAALFCAGSSYLYFHKPAASKAAAPVETTPVAIVEPTKVAPPATQPVVVATPAPVAPGVTIDERYTALAGNLNLQKYTIQKGDSLGKIANAHTLTLDFLAHLNHLSDPRRIRLGANLKIVNGPFHAVITKHTYSMDLMLGDKVVLTLPVGLGKDNSTPTGEWICEKGQKLKHPTYYPADHRVIEPGDPQNPLGNFWIGLAGTAGQAVDKHSYGIHGTNEPDSIGTQSSMGCVRLRDADIAVVFDLLVDGKSTVSVRD